MTLTFYSNFMNHHQLPFSQALAKIKEVDYVFVANTPIDTECLKLGYRDMNKAYPFVLTTYDSISNYNKARELAITSDIVIHGSAPEEFVKLRMQHEKLTFRYSERIYKNKYQWFKFPKHLVSFYMKSGRYKNLYMLCASAYTAADYAKTSTFINKTYKWGYFPEVKKYENIDDLIKKKTKASILWVARLIDWKHPEVAIQVAKRLKADGYPFNLNMIGNGVLEKPLKDQIKKENLEDCVHFLGAMTPDHVRDYMEKSEIFLFTSDFNEGWGAVLNESMNSGCAVVASHAIGSVPFLINDGKNGLIYKNGELADLYKKVKWLLDHNEERSFLGQQAYLTMTEQWNADNAASRFIQLSEAILKENKHPDLFKDGVCSKAENLKNYWIY